MLWVAAFLALIIWVLGMASGFLGLRIQLFLLLALLAGLAALLPTLTTETTTTEDADRSPAGAPNARSVPGSAPAGRSEEPTQTLIE